MSVESKKAAQSKYRKSHREELRTKLHEYQNAHREELREKNRARYYANIEKHRKEARVRMALHQEYRETSKVRRKENRDSLLKKRREFEDSHPDILRAWQKTWRLKMKSILVKPDACSRCGAGSNIINAHHEDYSKPEKVEWLCPKCHKRVHIQRRFGYEITD
jgi:ribosomal protein S27AE